jgi:hypothetical protein
VKCCFLIVLVLGLSSSLFAQCEIRTPLDEVFEAETASEVVKECEKVNGVHHRHCFMEQVSCLEKTFIWNCFYRIEGIQKFHSFSENEETSRDISYQSCLEFHSDCEEQKVSCEKF